MSKGRFLVLVDVNSIVDGGINESELADIVSFARLELVPAMEMCSAFSDSWCGYP